jgi:hypothetical protein
MADAEQEVALAEEEQLEQEVVEAEPENLWELFLGGDVEVLMAEAEQQEQEVALTEEEQLEQEVAEAEPEPFLGGGVEVHDEILDSSNEDSGLGLED